MSRKPGVSYSVRRALLFVLLASVALQAEGPTFTLTRGHVTEQTDDCQFEIGQETLLLLHPKSMACVRMRELKGTSVRLQVVVEE